MTKRVTDKQRQVLEFIADYVKDNGYAPAIRDVSSAFGCSVKGAYDHVVALEKKGLIDRSKNTSRSILLADKGKTELRLEEQRRVPILGRVAAGRLSYAEQNVEDYVSLPVEAMGNDSAALFALRIKGDSMLNAGIREGDIAIFREQQTANAGDIVVAMVEDEATIKFFFRQAGRVVLKAANPLYNDIYLNEVAIKGRLKSLIRVYE